MSKRKTCPLQLISWYHLEPEARKQHALDALCNHESCAWWHPQKNFSGECALLIIAQYAEFIADNGITANLSHED